MSDFGAIEFSHRPKASAKQSHQEGSVQFSVSPVQGRFPQDLMG